MKVTTLVVSCAASLALVALAGCAGTSDASRAEKATKPNVAVFLSSAANSYEQAQLDGVKTAAAKLGAGDVESFDGGFDSAKQIAQIQDAKTSRRFDVFIIEPVDSAAVVAPLAAAAKAGVKVVCVTGACGPDASSITKQFAGQAGVVAIDYGKVGETLASRAVDACAGEVSCHVAYINGDVTYSTDRLALASVKKGIEGAGRGVELSGAQDGKYDAATSRKVMQDMLQRDPDIKVLVALSDQMAAGALQAIEAAGLTGKIKVVSAGASASAVEAVRRSSFFSEMVFVPRTMGSVAAEIGIQLAQGKSVAKTEVLANTLSPVGEFLTPSNVDAFVAEWK
jgi:ribose transport system substrate-binding protein